MVETADATRWLLLRSFLSVDGDVGSQIPIYWVDCGGANNETVVVRFGGRAWMRVDFFDFLFIDINGVMKG